MRKLKSLSARNFLSLKTIEVEFQDLTVLVGPNGAGKSNILEVIKFLRDVSREDLGRALQRHGSFDRLLFRGEGTKPRAWIELRIDAEVTESASEAAPDAYELRIRRLGTRQTRDLFAAEGFEAFERRESLKFKRKRGPGRRIELRGDSVEVVKAYGEGSKAQPQKALEIDKQSSGLALLKRLGKRVESREWEALAALFSSMRVFEIDVERARQPGVGGPQRHLSENASNLAGFLKFLHDHHDELFSSLLDDLKAMAPSVERLSFAPVSGAEAGFEIRLSERGLRGDLPLGQASLGTIRALGLLAMLHDPEPPQLTCIEEIDQGLHPHALERVIMRLRSARERSQFVVVTHSPTFASRLKAHELLVVERDLNTGATVIPTTPEEIEAMAAESGLRPGELWFSGVLGGVPR